MRVLSLAIPPDGEETCLVYLSRDLEAHDLVNGVPGRIIAVSPGSRKDQEEDVLYITVPDIFQPGHGDIISSESDEILLKVEERSEDRLLLSIKKPGFLSVSSRLSIHKSISVGILTVSDKGSRGERIDTSGPALSEEVAAIGGEVLATAIVPDEQDEIVSAIKKWSDSLKLNLVLVTGGTGLSERDVTPESLVSIADREVPGFGEKMRMDTSRITERAILSRTAAVTREKTLIIALPGSRKGALECFSAVASVIPHAIEIICGYGGECGKEHK
jgi:molybdenum cofactor synthesis domain-containing protein